MAVFSKRIVPVTPVLAGLLAVTLCGPALADAIDGNWCNAEGENLHIDGPAIVTPGGMSMSGNYSRHAFSYISPPDEDFAGERLDMILHSEELMSMRLPSGETEMWRRCEVVSRLTGGLFRRGQDPFQRRHPV
ncbi:MAG: hypothetical protein R3D45_06800 [Rhizobiaceae bacterium]